MVARSTKGQRSFEPQGLCPTATYLAQSIRGHHTFQRGRLGQMPGKQTLNARVAETTLTFSPRGGPRKGWGAEGEGMVRFIVALLALLASTAAMAEPQRQTFKDAVASSVARRPTRVATPRITRWVATPGGRSPTPTATPSSTTSAAILGSSILLRRLQFLLY